MPVRAFAVELLLSSRNRTTGLPDHRVWAGKVFEDHPIIGSDPLTRSVRRPDLKFQNFGQYVRTNFPKFSPMCSDYLRHLRKFSNFVRMAHLAILFGPADLASKRAIFPIFPTATK